MRPWRALSIVAVVVSGCSGVAGGDLLFPDASAADAGGEPWVDAGSWADAGAAPDAGVSDAATPDAGPADAGPIDAGPLDGGAPDAGRWDAGAFDAGLVDAGLGADLCPLSEKSCLAHNQRRHCGPTPAGLRWQSQTCAAGSGCVGGDCVIGGCSDECNLGQTDGGKSCQPYRISDGSWPARDPAGSLHDRARDYDRWLRRDGMAAGGVGSAKYSDPPAYTQLEFMDGIGDSALSHWGGGKTLGHRDQSPTQRVRAAASVSANSHLDENFARTKLTSGSKG